MISNFFFNQNRSYRLTGKNKGASGSSFISCLLLISLLFWPLFSVGGEGLTITDSPSEDLKIISLDNSQTLTPLGLHLFQQVSSSPDNSAAAGTGGGHSENSAAAGTGGGHSDNTGNGGGQGAGSLPLIPDSEATIKVIAKIAKGTTTPEVIEIVDTPVVLPVDSIFPTQTVTEYKVSPLYPGYNWISLPLEVGGIAMTSDLARYIESHANKEVRVVTVSSWNAVAQSYTTYTDIPVPLGDHPVSPCQAYKVFIETEEPDGSVVTTFTGKVPELCAFDLKTTTETDYNWISIPLGRDDITTASQLKRNIESYSNPATTVLSISEWDPIEQNYRTFPELDFPVKEGKPYRVEVAQDALWAPGEQPSNPVPPSHPEQPRFEVTLNESEPVKVIAAEESFEAYRINIVSPIDNPRIDISAFSSGSDLKVATIPAAIEMNAEIEGKTISVQIPKTATVSAPASWDSMIKVPAFKLKPTVVPSAESGKGVTVLTTITVGSERERLTFDKAVRILFPKQAGKLAGFISGEEFIHISEICSDDLQSSGDSLPEGGDCKIDVGSDLLVWTKHFTEFVVYEENDLPNFSNPQEESGRDYRVAWVSGGIAPYSSNPSEQELQILQGEADNKYNEKIEVEDRTRPKDTAGSDLVSQHVVETTDGATTNGEDILARQKERIVQLYVQTIDLAQKLIHLLRAQAVSF